MTIGNVNSDGKFAAKGYTETIAEKDAEIERLLAENARLVEDRARFHDRPDDIGRMIEAHIGNLKLGKSEAYRHACSAFAKLHTLAAEIERLRAGLQEIEFHDGPAGAVARQVLGAGVQQPPCKRCGGKGEYTVEITNHGERNEFFQEVCKDCGGGPVPSAPAPYDAELGTITANDREYAIDMVSDLEIDDLEAQADTAAQWIRKVRYEAVIADRKRRTDPKSQDDSK